MTDPNNDAAANLGIPRCVCAWKNCRVYQKTFRELHHDYWDGVIKLKLTKGEPESMALKDSMDRVLKVPVEKRNEWKKVKNGGGGGSSTAQPQEVMRYTIARHHFTERHIAKYLQDPRNYSFLKPFTQHGAKKYLCSVDPTFTLKGEDGEILYLQVPNNTKEIVKAHYMKLKGQPGGTGATTTATDGQQHQPTSTPAAPTAAAAPPPSLQQHLQQQHINPQQPYNHNHTSQQQMYQQQQQMYPPPQQQQPQLQYPLAAGMAAMPFVPGAAAPMVPIPPIQQQQLLHQKEIENSKLKEQLESMQSQLSFLHDMVRKLQEEQFFDTQSARGGTRATYPNNNNNTTNHPTYGTGAAGRGGTAYSNPNAAAAGSMRSRHTISSRSGRSGVPHEIELGDETVVSNTGRDSRMVGDGDSQQFIPETDFDWSEQLEYENDGDSGVRGGTNNSHRKQSVRRNNSFGSVVSCARSIVSTSKSIKSLPREIELDEDDDDSDTHESLEEEAFDNRSMVSSKQGPSAHSRENDGGFRSSSNKNNNNRADQTAKQGPNSRKPSRRDSNSQTGSTNGILSAGGAGSKKPSSLAVHLNNNGTTAGSVASQDVLSTDQSGSVAGTYQVQALVVTDPYGEQGTYTGSISNSTNMPHGYGRLEYDRAGRWYEGDWKHGRWTGQGRLSNGDGDYYEGGLKNDHKHGKGIMKFADGRIFEGEYINGQMIEGKMTYQDGSTYTGTWVDGMRHGKGRCVFTDNSIYEGEFREGEFFGVGKMTWSDGGWYEGSWVYGEMDGFGKEVRPDGSLRHEGQWRKGQPIRNAK